MLVSRRVIKRKVFIKLSGSFTTAKCLGLNQSKTNISVFSVMHVIVKQKVKVKHLKYICIPESGQDEPLSGLPAGSSELRSHSSSKLNSNFLLKYDLSFYNILYLRNIYFIQEDNTVNILEAVLFVIKYCHTNIYMLQCILGRWQLGASTSSVQLQ